MKVEREGQPIELAMTLAAGSLRDLGWLGWEIAAAATFTFVLALIIGARRPRDPAARIGAWLMATTAMTMVFSSIGWASFWRHLPAVLALLFGSAAISTSSFGAISITFAIFFPRMLIHKRLLWGLIWLPEAIAASVETRGLLEVVYRPKQRVENHCTCGWLG
jgi:hypothetical protein